MRTALIAATLPWSTTATWITFTMGTYTTWTVITCASTRSASARITRRNARRSMTAEDTKRVISTAPIAVMKQFRTVTMSITWSQATFTTRTVTIATTTRF